LTAGEILNKWPEAEVARILRDYGEERRWRHLAHKIVEQRLAGGIHTTAELVELIGGSTFGITSNPLTDGLLYL
jgi:16S rRNA (cytosine1402-N4)-methyltransferase